MWVKMIMSLPVNIMNKTETHTKYMEAADKNDILWLYNTVTRIATGEGAHSAGLEFLKF